MLLKIYFKTELVQLNNWLYRTVWKKYEHVAIWELSLSSFYNNLYNLMQAFKEYVLFKK